MVGNSRAIPPAARTPRLTCSAGSRRPPLQGLSSLQVLAIPMTGLRRTMSPVRPLPRRKPRAMRPSGPSSWKSSPRARRIRCWDTWSPRSRGSGTSAAEGVTDVGEGARAEVSEDVLRQLLAFHRSQPVPLAGRDVHEVTGLEACLDVFRAQRVCDAGDAVHELVPLVSMQLVQAVFGGEAGVAD